MEKWAPIFWIIGAGIAFLLFLVMLELVKRKKK